MSLLMEEYGAIVKPKKKTDANISCKIAYDYDVKT